MKYLRLVMLVCVDMGLFLSLVSVLPLSTQRVKFTLRQIRWLTLTLNECPPDGYPLHRSQ